MKCFSVLLALGIAGVACAQPSFSSEASTTMTGVQDTSNLWYGDATTGYGFSCSTNSGDPAYYINQIQLLPGSGWDSNLTFNIADYNGNAGHLGNGFSNNDYTLGTPMAQGTTYYWSNILHHDGAFSGAITPGIYSFDALFLGGTDSSMMNTLYDAQLQVEIVPKVDVTVTPSYDQQTIAQGGTSTVSETVQNNMANRTFVTTTWFITAMSQGPDNLSGNFVGNWFDQSIAPGGSLTGQHSTWTAAANQTVGTYTGDTGIVGGLYNGDQLWFGNPGNTSINVVAAPEPASMVALGLGVLAVIRRRRKA